MMKKELYAVVASREKVRQRVVQRVREANGGGLRHRVTAQMEADHHRNRNEAEAVDFRNELPGRRAPGEMGQDRAGSHFETLPPVKPRDTGANSVLRLPTKYRTCEVGHPGSQ